MISSVTFEKTTYNVLPHKFEAGTPHIAGGIGLGAAIDFVNSIGLENIARHEQSLLAHGTRLLDAIPRVRIVGTARDKGGVISFVVENPSLAPLDVGTRLDADGIAVRTGHHCCQPVMDRLMISATARASFAIYNTQQEIEVLAESLKTILETDANRMTQRRATATDAGVAQKLNSDQIQFPAASAMSPQIAADELIETFEFLGDWEQRHQYLIDEGDKLPPMLPEMKVEAHRVRGCMSTVHLVTRKRPGTTGTMEFLADSDAAIVRGLISILQRVYSGQTAVAILAFDIEGLLKRLGLDQQLSMGRRNGLSSMIERIRTEATSLNAQKGK